MDKLSLLNKKSKNSIIFDNFWNFWPILAKKQVVMRSCAQDYDIYFDMFVVSKSLVNGLNQFI